MKRFILISLINICFIGCSRASKIEKQLDRIETELYLQELREKYKCKEGCLCDGCNITNCRKCEGRCKCHEGGCNW